VDRLAEQTRAARARLDTAGERVAARAADPAITSQPDPKTFLTGTRAAWARDDQAAQQAARKAAAAAAAQQAARHDSPGYRPPSRQLGRRPGPSLGR